VLASTTYRDGEVSRTKSIESEPRIKGKHSKS